MRRLTGSCLAFLLAAAPAVAQPHPDAHKPVHHPGPHPVHHPPRRVTHPHHPPQHHPVVHAPPHPKPPKPAVPVVVPKPAPPPDANKGSITGLPLPRFASLRSDDVNLRAGPGTRYPIEWVYKRRDLPVEIEREFEVWRLVRDPDGTRGWVHQATLWGRRTLIVTGAEHSLRDGPHATAQIVAKLEPGVLGRLRSCGAMAGWCKVQVRHYSGWLRRGDFWGTLPGEAVHD